MDYYNEIKNELVDNEVNKRIKDYSKNKYELEKYYNVGKLLSEAGKHYGEGIIKEYSRKLSNELNKKYTKSSLYNMLNFFEFINIQKFQTLSGKLSWSHYCELLTIKDVNKIHYYVKISEKYSLSVWQLRNKIKSNEYERLPEETKNKFLTNDKSSIVDFVKDPIIIKNINNYEIISEKVLQKLIIEDLPSFLDELGTGFTFVRNEYMITIGDSYNYIYLLLFNIEYNCYVVVELKVTELKKEHIGQIEIYMNYIDKNLRNITQDRTIGIIICNRDNKYVIEYCSDERIIARTYEVI